MDGKSWQHMLTDRYASNSPHWRDSSTAAQYSVGTESHCSCNRCCPGSPIRSAPFPVSDGEAN